jgi:ABC-type multidrug transport system permease subunit
MLHWSVTDVHNTWDVPWKASTSINTNLSKFHHDQVCNFWDIKTFNMNVQMCLKSISIQYIMCLT